eukprot:996839_1
MHVSIIDLDTHPIISSIDQVVTYLKVFVWHWEYIYEVHEGSRGIHIVSYLRAYLRSIIDPLSSPAHNMMPAANCPHSLAAPMPIHMIKFISDASTSSMCIVRVQQQQNFRGDCRH